MRLGLVRMVDVGRQRMAESPVGERGRILARNMRAIMSARNLSGEDVSRRTSGVLPSSVVRRIARGVRGVPVDDLFLLADAFDMPISQLTDPDVDFAVGGAYFFPYDAEAARQMEEFERLRELSERVQDAVDAYRAQG